MHVNGPLVVFAGAGSGKTRVITTRIAYLIEQGVRPWEILAVTFTNKAAGEMKSRVESISPEAKRSLITTFHSACARWLREFAQELGYQPHFTIYDDADTKSALKRIVTRIFPQGDIPTILGEVKAFIQTAKTNGLFPADVERLEAEMPMSVPVGAGAIYKAYQEALANSQAMDFSDLLLNMLLLLRNNQKVRHILQSRYAHILVDEFQDTNRTQFELIHILAGRHKNLFVVGDDDQSIYSWRGATPSNIIDFQTTYPSALRVTMEENYRCSANIVNAASAMIANNRRRAAKTLYTKKDDGDPIDYHIEIDGEMEAEWVVRTIKEEIKRFPLDHIAIFYRTNSQSRVLEEALTRENVSYTIYGSLEFYARMEIKDLLSYLKLMINENDEVALRRIINIPTRGIGDKALEIIEKEAMKRGLPLIGAVRAMADESIARLSPKLRFFVDLLDALKKDLLKAPLSDVIGILLDAIDYGDYLKKKYADQYADKMDNIHELGAAIAEYTKRYPEGALADWLQQITLVKDEHEKDTTTGVSLMTLHMAKGLEFRRVFLVGLEDGLLPHRNSLDQNDQLEEERRLFYVGMTRAKEKLSLISAARRRTYNSIAANPPSRFLKEIPQSHLKVASEIAVANASGSWESDDDISYIYEDEAPPRLVKGAQVFHPTYGKGVIESFENEFGNQKVVVRFYEHGSRKIRPSQLMRG